MWNRFAASVGYQAWSGDRPFIYFAPVLGVDIAFEGDKQRRWKVYHDLVITRPKDIAEFGRVQPKWAFVVTNGTDQVALLPNVGKAFLTWHHKASGSQMSVIVSEDDAVRMSRDLWEQASKSRIKTACVLKDAKVKPIGQAVTYTGKMSKFHASFMTREPA
jgi:hypothetical protein